MPEPAAAEDAEAIASANEFLVAQRRAAGEASSQYYGVHWNGRVRKWRAQLQHNYKTTDLLKSDSEEEAARAFDAAARRARRPASTLNFPTAAELAGQDEPPEPPKAAAPAEKKPKKKPPPPAAAAAAAQAEGELGADEQEEKPPNSVATNNPNGKKGYTPEVDEWLVSYIDKHGNRKASWDALTKLFDGERSEASLRSRWSRLVKGQVKGQTVRPHRPHRQALPRQDQASSGESSEEEEEEEEQVECPLCYAGTKTILN